MNAPERVLARVRRYIEALPPKQQAAAKKQLADAIGLGEGTIRGWLNGSSRAMPRLEYLDALATAMQTTTSALVSDPHTVDHTGLADLEDSVRGDTSTHMEVPVPHTDPYWKAIAAVWSDLGKDDRRTFSAAITDAAAQHHAQRGKAAAVRSR